MVDRPPPHTTHPISHRIGICILIALLPEIVFLPAGLRTAEAQQSVPAQQFQPQPQVQPQPQPSAQWAAMPRMQLERQYAGPLQDTIVQRWRDPVDGSICYIYLPITAQHSPPTASGFVQYGGNTIGAISCLPAPPAPHPAAAVRRPPHT